MIFSVHRLAGETEHAVSCSAGHLQLNLQAGFVPVIIQRSVNWLVNYSLFLAAYICTYVCMQCDSDTACSRWTSQCMSSHLLFFLFLCKQVGSQGWGSSTDYAAAYGPGDIYWYMLQEVHFCVLPYNRGYGVQDICIIVEDEISNIISNQMDSLVEVLRLSYFD